MNYTETLDYLYNSLPMFQRVGGQAYKPGLANTLRLDEHFGHPHRHYLTVHIAGTNGKGSVSHMLAAVLQRAGYKTGLYTSPHLVDFRERIRIDGQMIDEQSVIDFIETNRSILASVRPSFFEMTAALAFKYFDREGVDIAVIETGMGGRLDSTNILTPLVSVITNISLDHTQFLGETETAIAVEKAGIFKPGVPAVVGETSAVTRSVFEQRAAAVGSPLIFADQCYTAVFSSNSNDGQHITVRNSEGLMDTYTLDLLGRYQQKNLVTVLAVIDGLNRSRKAALSPKAIRAGLRDTATLTGLKGRWQQLAEHPLVIVDTAHNAAGIKEVVDQIQRTRHNKLYIVLGMVSDKDILSVLRMLPKDAVYHFTQAKIPRAMDAKILGQKAKQAGLSGTVIPDVTTAYQHALDMAGPDDMVFVGGSTFVVGDLLEFLSDKR